MTSKRTAFPLSLCFWGSLFRVNTWVAARWYHRHPTDAQNLYGKGERSEVGQVRINLPSRADLPLETWEVPEGWLGPRRCTLRAHLSKPWLFGPSFQNFSLRDRRG